MDVGPTEMSSSIWTVAHWGRCPMRSVPRKTPGKLLAVITGCTDKSFQKAESNVQLTDARANTPTGSPDVFSQRQTGNATSRSPAARSRSPGCDCYLMQFPKPPSTAGGEDPQMHSTAGSLSDPASVSTLEPKPYLRGEDTHALLTQPQVV
ncbi:hypothetical protein EYF80_048758 [Liparis tanakae]|uniref:Uncharacterized protein n=1 Tax=Liparis tanakae TaxID=230148 RepID=A0A4Z2FJG9_9TELE|nr:hypothetical protein EYF80_048758 [Liparis tanakae]